MFEKVCPGCKIVFIAEKRKRIFCGLSCSNSHNAKIQAVRLPSLEERLWSRVNKNGPIHPYDSNLGNCWLWLGATSPKGYGVIGVAATKTEQVHRVVWRMKHGEIPHGMYVCHSCDRRNCVNHLFLGTPKDNTSDMLKKGREARGERSGTSKLSTGQIVSIRTITGKLQREIAKEFGVDQSSISKIRSRLGWRHV